MSTVAHTIKNELQNKANISCAIMNLLDFYIPYRGNMRRNRLRANSIENLPDDATIIKQNQELREKIDFDDPQNIDWDLLILGIEQLKYKLKPFNKPVYDRFKKIRTEETHKIEPQQVIIIEGDLIFCKEKLRALFDLSVYIDTDDDVRLSRRVLKNELLQEGRDKIPLAELLKTYEEKTKPAFERYIEPTKKFANTIIPNYGFSTKALELDKMVI